jgi:hypothetical protein
MGWVKAAFALSGLVLVPFGAVQDLVHTKSSWYGFDESQAPVLWATRVQTLESAQCEKWVQALSKEIQYQEIALAGPASHKKSWDSAWKAWESWSQEDREAVEDCDDFPCDVKLNEKETSQMEATSKENRMEQWKSLVRARATSYEKNNERKEYEFPGDPIDPWTQFEKRGYLSSNSRPTSPTLYLRKLDFAPGKIRPIRQVLDRRVKVDAQGKSITVWIRDAYTDHYFDGWGEWIHLNCKTPPSGKAIWIHSLFLELDLLKKNDLFSRIGRGKLKSAIEENGKRYLEQAYLRVKDSVNSHKRELPQSLPSSGVAQP